MEAKTSKLGQIEIDRQILDKVVSRLSAKHKAIMLALLLNVSNEEKDMIWEDETITLKPGQMIITMKGLMELSGSDVSIQNVKSFVINQTTSGFLTDQSAKPLHLLSIVDWNVCDPISTKRKTKGSTVEGVPYKEIIDILNLATGKKFKATTLKTKSHINARWAEGYRLEDFEQVIRVKVAKWGGTPAMEEYLRPETLFGSKFEGYMNEKVTVPVIPEISKSPRKAGEYNLSKKERPW